LAICNAKPGIIIAIGVSCNDTAVTCTTNVNASLVNVSQCFKTFDPCALPPFSQFQYYRPFGEGGYELLHCGTDANCNTCTSFFNFTCDTCYNVSGNSTRIACPVTNVIGSSVACNTDDCSANPISQNVILNKCVTTCNPCNGSEACKFYSYTSSDNIISQYQYSDATCPYNSAVFLTNYSCGDCNTANFNAATGSGTSVSILCPSVGTESIAVNLNDAVTAASVAARIQNSALIPAGTTIKPPTNANVDSEGVLSFTLSIDSSVTLTDQQVADIRTAITQNIVDQFNIYPSTRVTVNWAKKRAVHVVTNTATVTIAAAASTGAPTNGASGLQFSLSSLMMIMIVFILLFVGGF